MSSDKGQRFSKLLKEIGLSATALASEADISRSSIYNYKEGKSILPHDLQGFLRKHYNFNSDWYLRNVGSMLIYESTEDSTISGNEELSAILAETFNKLPPESRYLVAEIKRHFLKSTKTIGDNEEAMNLLKKIHDDLQNRLI